MNDDGNERRKTAQDCNALDTTRKDKKWLTTKGSD